ncbi:hypothetical protein HAZT_HAZT008951 [Hyalella azteca]|uniref:Metalloendopeptidase n=1 Tax=Hyalella azteca TaxID=294128 RepID=A0A6A0GWZ2_HYAAZ|nr:hypothetical protein HAZT_HAZT008951 [Hyalella azteca]
MQQLIQQAMSEISKKTCISFVKMNLSHDHVVNIMQGKGCYSTVGRQPSSPFEKTKFQDLSLAEPGCDQLTTVLHELIHAIGFGHEHARWDRDNYIYIDYDKVKPSMRANFAKSTRPVFAGWERFPYDYKSIMHYGGSAFSVDGSPTMIPLLLGAQLGNSKGMTEIL